jgi:hypothetical protein
MYNLSTNILPILYNNSTFLSINTLTLALALAFALLALPAMEDSNASMDVGSAVSALGIESFSTLWAGKELTGKELAGARNLILPDSLRPKFYLPDEIGRKRRRQKGIERDRQRLEFLCRRDSMQQYGCNETRFAANKLLGAPVVGSRLESEIMQRLLAPYAGDAHAMRSLFGRVQEVLRRREAAALRRSPRNYTNAEGVEHAEDPSDAYEEEDIFAEGFVSECPESSFDGLGTAALGISPRPPSGEMGTPRSFHRGGSRCESRGSIQRQGSTTAEKAAAALSRRQSMEEEYTRELSRRCSLLEDRQQSAISRANSMKESQISVGGQWTSVILTIKAMDVFRSIVSASRQVKSQDRAKWRAAVVIQRLWRKSSQIDSMYKAADVMLHDSEVMQAGARLAEERAAACRLLVQFLSALRGGLRSAVTVYIRKVKLLQRRWRAHRLHNDGRAQLLHVLYDKCFAAIQHQVSAQVLKRVTPAGSNSINSIGSEKWKKTFATGPHNRIMRDLMSPELLQYIKGEILHPARKDLKRAYFSAVIVVDPAWRQAALHDLLLKCRWEETRSVEMAKKKMGLYEHMPVITQRDARSFIKMGKDPLAVYMQKCDDSLSIDQAVSNGTADGTKGNKLIYFTFLSHITATDMVDIVFESISNTIEQPSKIKSDRNSQSRVDLGDGTMSARPSNPNSKNLGRRFSRNSGVFGNNSRDIDIDESSDTMSVGSRGSFVSSSSRASFSAPPGSRRNSKRGHKHTARKLVEKKQY